MQSSRRRLLGRLAATVTGAGLVAGSLVGAPLAGASGVRAGASLAGASHVASTPVRGSAGAAAWLARQFGGHPYIPSTIVAGTPDVSDTAQAVLAMVASRTQRPTVLAAMSYLRRHVRTEITTTSGGRHVGNPGAIAFLILDVHATGMSARHFGGVDLVDALLATMHRRGRDTGLFGASAPTFDGAYRQGLSLAALAGVHTPHARLAPAVGWLERQQCSSGGWEAYRTSTAVACTPRDPKTFSGPDTNSTALAVEGLVAAGAAVHHRPFDWLRSAQDRDGGWGYFGAPSDTDSTAVVVQALAALHRLRDPRLVRVGGTPQGALRSRQVTSGPGAGGLVYQLGGHATADLLATEQAGPALAGLAWPLAAHTPRSL